MPHMYTTLERSPITGKVYQYVQDTDGTKYGPYDLHAAYDKLAELKAIAEVKV